MDAAAATKELSFSCFYTFSGDVSVRVSEDLATAYQLFFTSLYVCPGLSSRVGVSLKLACVVASSGGEARHLFPVRSSLLPPPHLLQGA